METDMPGQISIRLPNQIIDDLNALARRTGTRRADVVREAIGNHLSRVESDQPSIESLIADMKTEVLEAIEKQMGKIRRTEPNKTKDRSTVESRADIDVRAEENNPTPTKRSELSRGLQKQPTTASTSNPEQTVIESRDSSQPAQTDERILRLRAAQAALELTFEDIAIALNLSTEQVIGILDESVRIPPSRALRMEAKLQQWEAKVQVD